MKANEVYDYIKDFKGDVKELKADLLNDLEELKETIKELSIEFRDHTATGSPYRNQVNLNKNHINELITKTEVIESTLIEFMKNVEINSSKLDHKIQQKISQNKDFEEKKKFILWETIGKFIDRYPKLSSTLFTLLVSSAVIKLMTNSPLRMPLKHLIF